MADTRENPSWAQLGGIFDRSFRANPKNFQQGVIDPSPIEDMLGQSQLLDLARLNLPETAGDTQAMQWLLKQLPAGENPDGVLEKVKRAAAAMPLGGYSQQTLDERKAMRALDPEVRRYTTMKGEVPVPGGDVEPTGDSLRKAAAQNLGVAAADVASDGLRNIWWFLNAPQAIASIATLQALHQSGKPFEEVGDLGPGRFLKSRGMRLAATMPAMIGMSMAVGNFSRQPGYTAAVPSEADKTQTADPLAEAGARYILGRTGSLLPYDEFVKERPDVSKGEYEAYKAYLHGNALPLKATLDGINGPEVTFLGKSIPVLTGVLPAVAAVAGTAYGVRKAGRALQDLKLLEKEAQLRAEHQKLKGINSKATPEQIEKAYQAYAEQHDANQGEILKQALVYSAGGLTGAALAGQTLELIRRSLKGDAAAEPEPQVVPPAAPAPAVSTRGAA